MLEFWCLRGWSFDSHLERRNIGPAQYSLALRDHDRSLQMFRGVCNVSASALEREFETRKRTSSGAFHTPGVRPNTSLVDVVEKFSPGFVVFISITIDSIRNSSSLIVAIIVINFGHASL